MRRYTPELAVSLQIPGDVQVSPDGRRVVWVTAPIGHAQPIPASSLWQRQVDGAGEPRQLTAGDAEDRAPRWSPDGRLIAFLSDREQRAQADRAHQLWVTPAEGGTAQRLTGFRRGVDLPAWSPDGRAVTVTVDRLVLAGAEDPPVDVRVASLLPRPRVIVRIPLDGGSPGVVGPAAGHVWDYAWSPSGRELAVVTSPSDLLDSTPDQTRVILLDASTRAERELLRLARLPASLAWSPDGRRLAVVGILPGNPDDQRVILLDLSRGDITTLDPGESTPLWAGWLGERTLLILSAAGLWTRFTRYDMETGTSCTLEPVPPGGWVTPPASLSLDRRTLGLIRQSPLSPPEVWAGPWDEGLRCLTELNPQLAGVELAPMEPVEWQASDGLAIQGWLLTPPGSRQGQRLPLVVDIHGGPSAVWGATFHATWHDWGQVLAGAGFAVLLPNPRGSIGRGAAFTAANRNDLGGGDADDVLRGVDWCVAQGVADPDRLGVGGWSYGGFLTAWLIGHTDRFRAAVCGAAVTNWASKVGTTDIRPLNEDRFPGPLHEQPDAYWERSPIRYLGRIKTPTLIVHGEADQRVPPGQGLELYLGLREAGVPAELVLYPRQKHAFHERAHQLDLLRRIVAWYERWLTA
ncbi:Dipeptidyl-peptidase 5 [bacterium HR26]|nr:Dipeptidyl-peptidase 5 [bacterium HR26]